MRVTYKVSELTLAVALCLCPTSTVSASLYSDMVLGDGPVAYWRLGESSGLTAYDSAGAHNASYTGTMNFNEPGPIVGDSDTAVDFTGGSASTPWTADLNSPVFTVECWARADLLDVNWRTPYMTRWVDPDSAPSYLCYGHNFYKDKDNHNWEFWIGRGPTVPGFYTIDGPLAKLDEWVHLVGSYDGTTMRFYVDGSMVGSAVVPYGPVPQDKSTFKIATGASSFIGGLDEMAVYDRALSFGEVADHYATGSMGMTSPLADMVVYHFDEGAGATIKDFTANKADATSYGPAWTAGRFGGALSFDGDDDYARTTLFPAGLYSELTVEMWVNPGAEPGLQTVLNEQSGDTLWINISSGDKLAVYLGDTNNKGYHYSNASIAEGQWTHLALTYSDDTDTLQLYVNGQPDNSFTTSGVLNFDNSITLGMREDLAGAQYYKGLLDELAMYGYALSADEILFRAIAGPPVGIPEPTSAMLLGLALLTLVERRSRRRR